MKKLIITMGALAMFALAAQAAGALKGAVDFDSYEVGTGILIKTLEEGFQLWDGDNGDSIVTADEDGNKFLKVDTTTGLERKTTADTVPNPAGADKFDSVAIPEGGNITVSSRVQFTAAEDGPEPERGDKIIVWAKTPDEEGGDIKLMVTARSVDGSKQEFDTGKVVNAGEWYDLSIIATDPVADEPLQFMVKVGEEAFGPYTSLVNRDVDNSDTISSIGFKGTGAVDDIVFTREEGVVLSDVTVTVVASEGVEIWTNSSASVSYTDPITVKAGETVTIYVGDDYRTKKVTASVGTVGDYDSDNGVWPVTYTTTKDDAANGVTLVIMVEEGGELPEIDGVKYEDGEAFVAAATKATGNTIPNGWTVEGNVVKNAEGGDFAIFPDFYTVGLNDGVLTLALNDKAKDTVAIDTNAKVVFNVDFDVDGAAGVALAVTVTNSKLYYALASAGELTDDFVAPAADKFVQGNSGKLTLTAVKEGAKRFYKIIVTDVVTDVVPAE